ncbi:MAG: hypothetical protein AB7F74_05880 [Parvibaculaceae bacterium]
MKIDPYAYLRTRFEFAYATKVRLASVDAWLKHAVPEDDGVGLPALSAPFRSDPCAQYVARILHLGRLVLQQWRIPVFVPARLVKILPQLAKAGSFTCEVEQPSLDAVSPEVYGNAYLLAADICAWCGNSDPARGKVQDFHALLEQRVKKNMPPYRLGGDSTIPVLRVAHRLGIPFFHLGGGIYQLGTGAKARYLDRSHGESDSLIGGLLSGDKTASVRMLRQHLLPVPLHFSVLSREAAIAAAATIGFPLVVKPADANRGEGVTVGVDSEAALAAAFDMARKRSRTGDVLIEQQAPGVCHRLFIVKGRLLYAVKRLPLFVTGDGTRSLRQIINAEVEKDQGRPYWRRSKFARFDASGFADLAARGIDCDAVPGFGERIFLRPIETTEWGGIDEETTHAVHPLNLKAAVEATRAFGLEVAGVDMISEDISVPWIENGAIINEVNAAPLLGGAEISRSYLATFFDIYLGGDGCIPVTAAGPDDSVEDLLEQQAARHAQGLRSWIVFADVAVGPQGQKLSVDGGPAQAGFDPKGRPLQYVSPPEEVLLLDVLRNRTVDHVVRVRGMAPVSLRTPGALELSPPTG